MFEEKRCIMSLKPAKNIILFDIKPIIGIEALVSLRLCPHLPSDFEHPHI